MKTLFGALSLLIFSACASHPTTTASSSVNSKQTLVLIQGVHLDGASWDAFKKFISNDTFRVTDLGRIGRDTDQPASLKSIAELSCKAIPEKAILVAHSYGGAIANEMVGICPGQIQKIIYVSAVIPLKGEKPFDQMKKRDSKAYSKAVKFEAPKINPLDAKTFFKITDRQVDVKSDLPALHSEWMSLTAETVDYDPAKLKAIPQAYVFTLKDPIISLKTQKNYVARAHIQKTAGTRTGHFPMLSDPQALAKIITAWSAHD